jgi:tRNA G18 (ribose-2'-O)-methylase SpoU
VSTFAFGPLQRECWRRAHREKARLRAPAGPQKKAGRAPAALRKGSQQTIAEPMHVPPFDMPVAEIRSELDRLRGPLRIAIQRSKNPFNVGAIIRVAHSFLVREIILIGDEPYYERASMGMEKYENITKIASEEAFLARAQAEDLKIVAIEKDHPRVTGLWSYPFPEARTVLVFGSENDGVSAEILRQAQAVVAIPMFGINHSYPVSVAAGIVMAEWARRYWGRAQVIAVPHERETR